MVVREGMGEGWRVKGTAHHPQARVEVYQRGNG